MSVLCININININPAPPCISYYKQNKLYRLVYDDSRQLECPLPVKSDIHAGFCPRLEVVMRKRSGNLADCTLAYFIL